MTIPLAQIETLEVFDLPISSVNSSGPQSCLLSTSELAVWVDRMRESDLPVEKCVSIFVLNWAMVRINLARQIGLPWQQPQRDVIMRYRTYIMRKKAAAVGLVTLKTPPP